MRITRDMRFVSKIDTIERGIVHFYSVQISRETFEQYFAELGDVVTYVTNTGNALDMVRVAPQLAYPALKKAAQARKTWDTKDGVLRGLIAEIERLTTVAFATDAGQKQLPLSMAVEQKILDEDDRADVLSQVVFFTALSRAAERGFATNMLDACGTFHGWEFTSASFSEKLNSLSGSTAPKRIRKTGSSVIS